jgi:hypothetical protein
MDIIQAGEAGLLVLAEIPSMVDRSRTCCGYYSLPMQLVRRYTPELMENYQIHR